MKKKNMLHAQASTGSEEISELHKKNGELITRVEALQ